MLALIGSNGAGKTTLVNLISGLLRADAGLIVFRGQDVTQQTVHERIAAGIARSFQLVNLFDQLSALDNVALSIFSREGKTRKLWSLAEADRPCGNEAWRSSHLPHGDQGAASWPGASPRASASCSTWPSPTRSGPSCCSSTSRPAA